MPTAPNLPTDVAPGDPGHATLHNDVNTSVNALAQDTGWRFVEDPPTTGAGTINTYLIRRIGPVVWFGTGDNAIMVPTSSNVEATLPAGFIAPAGGGTIRRPLAYSATGAVNVYANHVTVTASDDPVEDDAISLMSWPAGDAFPTTLPGVPLT